MSWPSGGYSLSMKLHGVSVRKIRSCVNLRTTPKPQWQAYKQSEIESRRAVTRPVSLQGFCPEYLEAWWICGFCTEA